MLSNKTKLRTVGLLVAGLSPLMTVGMILVLILASANLVKCEELNIPCTVVLDSSVGMYMSLKVDCVFVGAEAVLENGGIFNRIGTMTIALCAKAYNKPFYVFAESLKFLKRFPLEPYDIFAILDEQDMNNTDLLEKE